MRKLGHDNVKRTIETLGSKRVVTLPQIEEVPNDGPGPKTISIYNLGMRDSLIVVAQLCPEFTVWIKDRIEQYGFVDGRDYVIGSPVSGNQSAGRGGDRRSVDYHLTIDMAKELSMVERNGRCSPCRSWAQN